MKNMYDVKQFEYHTYNTNKVKIVMKIEVSNGEIVDKLTILKIKLKNIKDQNKLNNIQKEHDALSESVEYIKSRVSPIEFENLFNELIDINSRLWDIEDRIRIKEKNKEFDQEFIDLARSVYVTNDQRFECKKKVNDLTNSGFSEEKSYEKYD